ncbi:MAG: phenylalanine--tRNA ligase subunit beta, partial [Christensenellales bacterium]
SRACMLVNMLGCGKVVPGHHDSYPAPIEMPQVRARVSRICALTGVEISGDEMVEILAKLDIAAERAGDEMIITPPVYRGDIESEADIAEEVLRMHGYEHIPSTLMHAVTMPGKRSENQRFLDDVRASVAAMGGYEAINYSFITPRWLEWLDLPAGDWRREPLRILNPLGEDSSVMRTTLAPTMLDVMAKNIHRGVAEGMLFEVSYAFKPRGAGELPEQKLTLCIGMYGEGTDFYAIKNPVVWLLGKFGIRAQIEAAGDGYYHPGRKAVLRANDAVIAQMGEVHPDVAERFGIESRRVYLAEVDLDAVRAMREPIYGIRELPKYPAVSRDIAVVVDEGCGSGDVLEAIRKAGGRILEDVALFDIYRDARLGEGKKSLAYAMTLRAADRTLTEQEISRAMEKVLRALQEAFGAEIRK